MEEDTDRQNASNVQALSSDNDADHIPYMMDARSMSHQTMMTSTPTAESEAKVSIYRLPTLQSNDSGFAEGTLSLTPSSSIDGTPSSAKDTSPFITPSSTFDSLSPISPVSRKPIMRRSRHSDPGISSLVKRIQSLDDNDYLSRLSQSDIDITSEENTESIEETRPVSQGKSLMRNLLLDAIEERSRSSTSSSISEDLDLEANLQEMSLEESSDSERSSISPFPSSLVSSKSRSASPSVFFNESEKLDDKTLISFSDSHPLSSALSNETLLSSVSSQEDSLSQLAEKEAVKQKLEFTLSLSLTPNSDLSRPLDISKEEKFSSRLLNLPEVDKSKQMISSDDSPKANPSDLTTYQRSFNSSAHHISSPTKVLHHDDRYLLPSSKSIASDIILMKSPTKRTMNARCASISPLKVRRKCAAKKKLSSPSKAQKNVSQNLFQFTDTLHHERLPRHINSKFDDRDSSITSSHFYPENFAISDRLPTCGATFADGCSSSELVHIQSQSYMEEILQSFSPSVPSRLIGRRVGISKCDIVGELTRQNFPGCLEIIFNYLEGDDLVSAMKVSRVWYSSISRDRRWQRISHAHHQALSLKGKENALGSKLNDSESNVTTAKEKLGTVQAVVVPDVMHVHNTKETEAELLCDDKLRICPTCYGKALVYPSEDRAVCQRTTCAFNFCTLCFSEFHHPNKCKPLFPSSSKTDLAGTRKSKKNLRRL